MTTEVRRLGDGWEPHVDELADRLVYSLPVTSGHATVSFSFEIRRDDLDVLLTDPYRRAVLETVAHRTLQRSLVRGGEPVTRPAFADLVARVLHAEPSALASFAREFNREQHFATAFFVEQAMARRSRGA